MLDRQDQPAEPRASAPPTLQYADPSTAPPEGPLEPYNRTAETIGMIPTLRWSDNLMQAVAVAGGTALGVLVGYLLGGGSFAILGALIGLVLSTLVSGLALMLAGLARGRRRV